MIIVKLSGGLGNQMFQAAAGIALSERFKTKLKFDLSFLKENSSSTATFSCRKLAIDNLNYGIEFADRKDIEIFFYQGIGALDKISNKIKKLFRKPVIIEDKWEFESLDKKASRYTYLNGFWQSEIYFRGYEKKILEYFRFPDLQVRFNKLKEEIIKINSVSVHFRRGDYTNIEYIQSIHNVCDSAYYERAIKYLTDKQGEIKMFLFSDEPYWLKENFNSDFEFEIVCTDSDIDDMYLMSLCRHNIIANSSFSWWGAWLNRNPCKMVVAPQKWFATDIANYKGVVPESWIKL